MEGRISAFRPDAVRSPVDHPATITVSPRPNEGSQPSCTEKIRINRMPMRKVGSETPMSEMASRKCENQESRRSAV